MLAWVSWVIIPHPTRHPTQRKCQWFRSLYLPAVLATTVYSKMVRIDLESELRSGIRRQAAEGGVRSLEGRSTHLTDEVGMGAGRQMVGGGPMPKV